MLLGFVGGAVQGITGFGGSILMMIFLPVLYGIAAAPVVSDLAITGALALMTWHCRRGIQIKSVLPPAAAYFVLAGLSVSYLRSVRNLSALQAAFGLLLLVLALYLAFIASNFRIRPSVAAALICGGLSGITGGLFGIGGPLLALYFLALSDSQEQYLANNCLCMLLTVAGNDVLRVLSGSVTPQLALGGLCGAATACVGLLAGESIRARMNARRIKQCIYLLMALAGAIALYKGLHG